MKTFFLFKLPAEKFSANDNIENILEPILQQFKTALFYHFDYITRAHEVSITCTRYHSLYMTMNTKFMYTNNTAK